MRGRLGRVAALLLDCIVLRPSPLADGTAAVAATDEAAAAWLPLLWLWLPARTSNGLECCGSSCSGCRPGVASESGPRAGTAMPTVPSRYCGGGRTEATAAVAVAVGGTESRGVSGAIGAVELQLNRTGMRTADVMPLCAC